ncbi:23S rRNA (pseudouridine(1915)-N(3))-methyltransferase RlmH [Cohaesibacter celericrescens]|uniref:Ribosomal RNA large subunit methyltransferase H n=1 Tax=Cohaesibacter celericrescens TaxID=2067669 RepID=A0A2N5XPJ6_9HYPH|nr:23S rRNA (pseudouridine(1915)-N(3))-methyltransferase RlmH [Cohaesibacter celericrescens]PLW76414.1 23S rRNA (pseudouridine(1915)-N(3))-methyltransferase RlmH [Cohaesibacter celericrescens]
MKLILAAIGRQKAGPETELALRYQDRAKKAGRTLGLAGPEIVEYSESRARSTGERKTQEADQLLKALPAGCIIVALDEHGQNMSSESFAKLIDKHRNGGSPAMAFVLGGPDGHGQPLLDQAHVKLALGSMTWPHQIARVLLTEQIYRAITILTGHPYHRI